MQRIKTGRDESDEEYLRNRIPKECNVLPYICLYFLIFTKNKHRFKTHKNKYQYMIQTIAP